MPRIRCRYLDCVFLEDGYCGAAAIELDPDAGCLTYSQTEAAAVEEEWEDEDLDEEWEDEEEDLEEEEEDEEAWEDEEEEM